MRKNKEIKWKEELAELIKYGLAGGICTIANLFLFIMLQKVGIYYILANIISYLAAVLLNYFISAKFVFMRKKTKNQAMRKSGLVRFLLIRGGNLIADNGLFYLCVSAMGMSVYSSRLGLTLLENIITYGMVKAMVFQEKENECV